MQQGEHKISDTRGRFARVITHDRELNDAAWTTGRILLSNRRLVLAGTGGKRTIGLAEIDAIGGRYDVNQRIAGVSDYVSLELGDDVLLVAAADHEEFELDLYGALLDQAVVLTRHPAIAGGVVQNTDWEKARLKVDDDALLMATVSGAFVEIDLDDIGGTHRGTRTIIDETRPVVEVEHSDADTSVQTYISADDRVCTIISALLSRGEDRSRTAVDLDATDKQVLMALYSGVSPFDIPDFLGVDVDEVEALFENLVELNIVEEVRVRREVALNARGRAIASDVITEQ